MTIVIVQSRLGSTRLPGKALLDLCGKPVIARVLDVMRKVPADEYYLATDYSSFDRLSAVAEAHGWKCHAGSEEDVLDRFCRLIEKTGADTVVRATGDNPFLFSDAAAGSLEEYRELSRDECVDYFTYKGLPHGSGVEILNGSRLLEAEKQTGDSYDHEHVGPAFYRHQESFRCIFQESPEQWNHPELRTTIDTWGDYRNAVRMMEALKSADKETSFSSEDIISMMNEPYIRNPVLFVPSVKAGHGTGHLRRCLDAAVTLKSDILIPADAGIPDVQELAESAGIKSWQIIHELPEPSADEVKDRYSLVVADTFCLSEEQAALLWNTAPVVAVDEGSSFTDCCDYLLDVIPSSVLERKANCRNSSLIPLPQNRRKDAPENIRNVLVSIGGEDPAGFTSICAEACRSLKLDVTEVTASNPVEGLREKLAAYDMVITHYGFTAFEAAAAGCAVLLVETSPLHRILSESEGFPCIKADVLRGAMGASSKEDHGVVPEDNITELVDIIREYTVHPEKACMNSFYRMKDGNMRFPEFIRELSRSSRHYCPVCGKKQMPDEIIYRFQNKTYRKCRTCSLSYLAWISAAEEKYGESYFFEDYKKQYGKTYLEDFENIKKQGMRRMEHINEMTEKPGSILDVGCAYGPFLSAAASSGWIPYGTDISESAVRYVADELKFHAEKSFFPDFNPVSMPASYDAVTMWYVIEHFSDLDAVLKKVSSLLVKGGVFAFSTPSASGVSARHAPEKFFQNSPKDHFSIIHMDLFEQTLKKYGFRTVRKVSTGHHPERFPEKKGHSAKRDSFVWKYRLLKSHFKKLGDTFELYCIKEK